ncbi:MAG: PilZ domain-containing protein [Pseudomonadota bacterium]
MAFSSLIPRAFARLSSEEKEEFTLRFAPAIYNFLEEVKAKDTALTVFYDPKHFFMSHLFENNEGSMIIDAPPSVITPPVPPDAVLQIMGTLEYVPFYFIIPTYTIIEWDRFPAFRFAPPTTLIRLQRRSTFRLMIPLQIDFIAQLEYKQNIITTPIVDISMGGVRLNDIPLQLIEEISRGEILFITIELDGLRFRLAAQVTNAQQLRLRSGGIQGQLCLRFQEMPPATQHRLARFLMRQEVKFSSIVD